MVLRNVKSLVYEFADANKRGQAGSPPRGQID